MAEGPARCAVAKSRHAIPPAIRPHWFHRAALFVGVRALRADHRAGRNRNDHCGRVAWNAQPALLLRVSSLRIRIRDDDFDWLSAARRDYVQAVQRLEGCGKARQLLLPRTLSLPAAAHDVAIAGALSVCAGRRDVEAAQAPGLAIGAGALSATRQSLESRKTKS